MSEWGEQNVNVRAREIANEFFNGKFFIYGNVLIIPSFNIFQGNWQNSKLFVIIHLRLNSTNINWATLAFGRLHPLRYRKSILLLRKVYFWVKYSIKKIFKCFLLILGTLAVFLTRVCRSKTKNPWESFFFELNGVCVSLSHSLWWIFLMYMRSMNENLSFFLLSNHFPFFDVINFASPSLSFSSQPSSTLSSLTSPTHTYINHSSENHSWKWTSTRKA